MNSSQREPLAPRSRRVRLSPAVGQGSSRAAEAVVTVVPRAMRQIRAVARSTAVGLSVPQFRAMRYVDGHPGTGLTPLADHLGVSLPAASALVGRLVAAGLAERELDPQERRRIAIELTAIGRERSAASTAAVDAWWRQRLAGLPEPQLAALLDGLQILDTVLATDDEAVAPPVVA